MRYPGVVLPLLSLGTSVAEAFAFTALGETFTTTLLRLFPVRKYSR